MRKASLLPKVGSATQNLFRHLVFKLLKITVKCPCELMRLLVKRFIVIPSAEDLKSYQGLLGMFWVEQCQKQSEYDSLYSCSLD